jgi:hypothetical protein
MRAEHRGAVIGLAMLALWVAGDAPTRAAAEQPGRIERIELKTEAAATKVIVMLSRPIAFSVQVLAGEAARQSSERLVLDFANTALAPDVVAPRKVDDGYVQQIRTGEPASGKARIVLDLASHTKHTVEAYEDPPHVTIAISAESDATAPAAPAIAAPSAAAAMDAPSAAVAPTTAPTPVRGPKPERTATPRPKLTPTSKATPKPKSKRA